MDLGMKCLLIGLLIYYVPILVDLVGALARGNSNASTVPALIGALLIIFGSLYMLFGVGS